MKLYKKHNQEYMKHNQEYMKSMVSYSTKYRIIIFALLLSVCCISCKKLVEIDPPTDSITTSEVFSDSADATSAILGIYSNMAISAAGGFTNPTNAGLTILCGMSADELIPFTQTDVGSENFYTNRLSSQTFYVYFIWIYLYPYLYQANAILEGLQASSGLTQTLKDELSGEAKFFRGMINFYLVNLFGDIPLLTTIDYKSNALAARTPSAQVYQAIINDLKEAKDLLPANYSAGNGKRIRANKWAAAALLARVYLYTGDYVNAEAEATSIIGNTGMFTLVNDPNEVFLKTSSEAILQWQNSSYDNTATYNATPEGYILIPGDTTNANASQPYFFLSAQLIAAFEPGDKRKSAWVQSYTYQNIKYSYPFKYKIGAAEAQPSGPVTEYYTVLRLAEQYLIRAEARAQQGNLTGAIADLNSIRTRAGLPDLSASLSQAQIVSAVAQERRIELFAEWGHRWLDLKRTGQVAAVFSNISYKSAYSPYQNLYPIPKFELDLAPNLRQNPGY